MTFISPIHHYEDIIARHGPLEKWPIEVMIEVFFAQTDGWYLEVADRIINPWIDDAGNQPLIRAKDAMGNEVSHVPDSAFAVLQILCHYFEVVGYFSMPYHEKTLPRKRFEHGINLVFPTLIHKDDLAVDVIWHHVRGTLYHSGPVWIDTKKKTKVRRILLRHDLPDLEIVRNGESREIRINPHRLVKTLRKHLRDWCDELTDSRDEGQGKLFRKAFLHKYG